MNNIANKKVYYPLFVQGYIKNGNVCFNVRYVYKKHEQTKVYPNEKKEKLIQHINESNAIPPDNKNKVKSSKFEPDAMAITLKPHDIRFSA